MLEGPACLFPTWSCIKQVKILLCQECSLDLIVMCHQAVVFFPSRKLALHCHGGCAYTALTYSHQRWVSAGSRGLIQISLQGKKSLTSRFRIKILPRNNAKSSTTQAIPPWLPLTRTGRWALHHPHSWWLGSEHFWGIPTEDQTGAGGPTHTSMLSQTGPWFVFLSRPSAANPAAELPVPTSLAELGL